MAIPSNNGPDRTVSQEVLLILRFRGVLVPASPELRPRGPTAQRRIHFRLAELFGKAADNDYIGGRKRRGGRVAEGSCLLSS